MPSVAVRLKVSPPAGNAICTEIIEALQQDQPIKKEKWDTGGEQSTPKALSLFICTLLLLHERLSNNFSCELMNAVWMQFLAQASSCENPQESLFLGKNVVWQTCYNHRMFCFHCSGSSSQHVLHLPCRVRKDVSAALSKQSKKLCTNECKESGRSYFTISVSKSVGLCFHFLAVVINTILLDFLNAIYGMCVKFMWAGQLLLHSGKRGCDIKV